MNQRRLIPALFAVTLILGAWTTFHLDLVDSLPKEDQVLEEAPEVVWLEFSAVPDMSRSSFSIRGPEGGVELGEMEAGDEEEVIRARVVGEMPAGTYTLSWVGAPIDDHTVRGRFDFTIESAQ
jgi:methionine-rich copper-binding protein CopC